MNSVRFKRVIAFVANFLVLSWHIFPTISHATQNSYDLSVVIWPQRDGTSDDTTNDVSGALRKALPVIMPVHIIGSQITEDVLSYHQKEALVPTGGKNEAEKTLANAKEHYFQFQYDEALAESSRAVEIYSAGSISENGFHLQDALITQAIIAKAAGDAALAKNAFDRVVSLNPFYRIDKKLFPPSIVEMFEKSRSTLMQGASGSLKVETDPQAAEVFLNGILQGVTPFDLPQVPVGSYTLLIKTNKYQPVTKTITIADGEKLIVKEKLTWTNTQTGKKSSHTQNARAEIEEGLRIADLLKADKAVLIDCDENGKVGTLYARIVDRQYRAAHRPVVVEYDAVEGRAQAVADLTETLASLTRINLLNDPMKYLDPDGLGDPILLTGRKREFYKKPIFWGAIGAAAAGAIAGGIAAALSGGGSPRTGAVAVQFK